MTSSICTIHTISSYTNRDPRFWYPVPHFALASVPNLNHPSSCFLSGRLRLGLLNKRLDCSFGDWRIRRTSPVVASGPMFFSESPVVGDFVAMVFSGCFALSILRMYEETAKRGVFDQGKYYEAGENGNDVCRILFIEFVIDILCSETMRHSLFQKLNRKLVHTTIGLAFMLCWPLFSSGHQGAIMAALIPAINIVKVLLIGLGIWKDEAAVKSMSRDGDYRELIKGPLYYASTIALSSLIYWRTSPIAIAAICNLCAGDGMADIIGRRFGTKKIPYNKDKSFAGSIAMAAAGFIASVG
ncbi:probable phytol kinase 3, chloroplastic [Tanacetum coccineum]